MLSLLCPRMWQPLLPPLMPHRACAPCADRVGADARHPASSTPSSNSRGGSGRGQSGTQPASGEAPVPRGRTDGGRGRSSSERQRRADGGRAGRAGEQVRDGGRLPGQPRAYRALLQLCGGVRGRLDLLGTFGRTRCARNLVHARASVAPEAALVPLWPGCGWMRACVGLVAARAVRVCCERCQTWC